MAAEIHALILGFDHTYAIRDVLAKLIRKKVDIHSFVDSKTLFDVVAKDGTTTKKRLLIDIWSLREIYSRGELRNISWLPGKNNAADSLTKPVLNEKSPLWKIKTKNHVHPETIGWVAKADITAITKAGSTKDQKDDDITRELGHCGVSI